MAKVNSADVGFEKQIWNAADLLRGSMDASEYKHVVLGLIFLKYISDRFEQKYRDLLSRKNFGFERLRTSSLSLRIPDGVLLPRLLIHLKSER